MDLCGHLGEEDQVEVCIHFPYLQMKESLLSTSTQTRASSSTHYSSSPTISTSTDPTAGATQTLMFHLIRTAFCLTSLGLQQNTWTPSPCIMTAHKISKQAVDHNWKNQIVKCVKSYNYKTELFQISFFPFFSYWTKTVQKCTIDLFIISFI